MAADPTPEPAASTARHDEPVPAVVPDAEVERVRELISRGEYEVDLDELATRIVEKISKR